MKEKKNKNPLTAIKEFYDKTLAEEDAKGNSELYKKCFDSFIEYLKKGFITKYNQKKPTTFTVIDVEYLDGYFLFAYGTNSVVHFHIKELPGWKFGIWFNTDEKYKDEVYAQIFWQYEDYIDKFKPSASSYVFTINFDIKENEIICCPEYEVEKALKFILDEPALAFCKELFYRSDYEYHSRMSARIKKFKFTFLDKFNKKLSDHLQQYILKWSRREVEKLLGFKIYIYTRSPNVTPRYALYASIKEGSGIEDRDNLSFEEIDEKFNKKYNKINLLFSKCPEYYPPIHKWIIFRDEDIIKELMKEGALH